MMERILGVFLVLVAGGAGFWFARRRIPLRLQMLVVAAMATSWILIIFADTQNLPRGLSARAYRVLEAFLDCSVGIGYLGLPSSFVGWLGGIWLCLWERKDKAHGRSPQK
jgi:hypothetical protein